MSQELVSTSARRGIKPGSQGFCTVLQTEGMPPNLATRLEALSGYQHLFSPHDARANLNPVAFSHLKIPLGGGEHHVLSRVAPYGVDYSNRPNKLAHHVVLNDAELTPAGPAWLLTAPGFMMNSWDGQPQMISSGRIPPTGSVTAAVCRTWERVTGDAGWGGVLAETAINTGSQPVVIIYQPGLDLLGLFAESLALLPPRQRWNTTFSTYIASLGTSTPCHWQGVVEGSSQASELRYSSRHVVIDLCQPLGQPPLNNAVQAARTGTLVASLGSPVDNRPIAPQPVAPQAAQVSIPTPSRPTAAATWSPPPNSEGTLPPSLPVSSQFKQQEPADNFGERETRPHRSLIPVYALVLVFILALTAGGMFYFSKKIDTNNFAAISDIFLQNFKPTGQTTLGEEETGEEETGEEETGEEETGEEETGEEETGEEETGEEETGEEETGEEETGEEETGEEETGEEAKEEAEAERLRAEAERINAEEEEVERKRQDLLNNFPRTWPIPTNNATEPKHLPFVFDDPNLWVLELIGHEEFLMNFTWQQKPDNTYILKDSSERKIAKFEVTESELTFEWLKNDAPDSNQLLNCSLQVKLKDDPSNFAEYKPRIIRLGEPIKLRPLDLVQYITPFDSNNTAPRFNDQLLNKHVLELKCQLTDSNPKLKQTSRGSGTWELALVEPSSGSKLEYLLMLDDTNCELRYSGVLFGPGWTNHSDHDNMFTRKFWEKPQYNRLINKTANDNITAKFLNDLLGKVERHRDEHDVEDLEELGNVLSDDEKVNHNKVFESCDKLFQEIDAFKTLFEAAQDKKLKLKFSVTAKLQKPDGLIHKCVLLETDPAP